MDKPTSDAERLAALRGEINEETVRTVIHAMLYMMRDHADFQTKQPLMGIIRQLIQEVVIASTPGRDPPCWKCMAGSHRSSLPWWQRN
ncbi:hypothetical protein ACFSE1_16790 [Rhizobium helianthi]|uniref:Uncharacterized protein n=1 Tax=Rhizobium helianthi TaxID=1132695 RepID=A0ABW4M706_9HYPH